MPAAGSFSRFGQIEKSEDRRPGLDRQAVPTQLNGTFFLVLLFQIQIVI